MSFSSEVKEELIKHYTKKGDAQKAELAALILLDEKNVEKDFERGVFIYNFTSLRKTFNINLDFEALENLAKLTKQPECKRSFLRGAFIARGSINDPEKGYHMEIACDDRGGAVFLQGLLADFDLNPKITVRRDKFILYLKEGTDISDALNIIEAPLAMMNFENARIVREMRGSVNRQVNCETANINKTITASMRQIEDIKLIDKIIGIEKLDDHLKAIAKARLEHQDMPLAELGETLTPPVGKSGVNHRLRKISQIAEKLRAAD
ncbi:MAG: DNA-binding protein WhiA [Lachnospiraceae bacterium]|nr:DNA-binding protein WhiA [Lachnospiraceae bacterium]